MAELQRRGSAARALCLQGYLFFALAANLVETCRDLILRGGVRHLILDFRMVQGLDASAALAFGKLHQLCARHGASLVLSGLRPDIQALLTQMRFLPHRDILVVADLDRGLEWIEHRLLMPAPGPEGATPEGDGVDAAASSGEVDLRRILAGHFTGDALETLLGLSETLELPAGALLMRRGEAGDALYFVERGEVSVFVSLGDQRRKRVRTLGAGTVVGEMAIYSGQPRSADVVAETACRVRRLSAERFARLEREHPSVAIQFHSFVVRLLSYRLAAANDEIRGLL
jgi:SulP family sulfate permease